MTHRKAIPAKKRRHVNKIDKRYISHQPYALIRKSELLFIISYLASVLRKLFMQCRLLSAITRKCLPHQDPAAVENLLHQDLQIVIYNQLSPENVCSRLLSARRCTTP